MSIGQRIKELRVSKKLSQKELAEKLGVSRGNVGDWESEKSKPGADALLALSRFFGVTADWLLSGEEQPRNARISVHAIGDDFTPHEVEFLAKVRQLSKENRIKVEGIVEGLLISQDNYSQQSRAGTSSR